MRGLPWAIALLIVALAGCQVPGPAPAPSSVSAAPSGGLPVVQPVVDSLSATQSPSTSLAPAAPLSDRLHWSGTVEVTQSMLFLPWETLTIAPGTTVRFHSLPDGDLAATPWVPQADAYIKDHNDPTGHTGYASSHFSITGRITAVGTRDAPILFTSAADAPGYADWNQLILLGGSRLENVTTEYSHNGINVQGSAVLANVIAHDSLWSCIDVFAGGVELRDIEAYHCWHQAVGFKGTGSDMLTRASLHDSQVGLNCEGGAQPTVSGVTIAAAGLAPTCPTSGITLTPRAADVAGGTYAGVLVYPAP